VRRRIDGESEVVEDLLDRLVVEISCEQRHRLVPGAAHELLRLLAREELEHAPQRRRLDVPVLVEVGGDEVPQRLVVTDRRPFGIGELAPAAVGQLVEEVALGDEHDVQEIQDSEQPRDSRGVDRSDVEQKWIRPVPLVLLVRPAADLVSPHADLEAVGRDRRPARSAAKLEREPAHEDILVHQCDEVDRGVHVCTSSRLRPLA